MTDQDNPLIVALDYPDAASALALADKLDPRQCRVKVGKELFTSAGPQIARELVKRGFAVFLDLKFHDIPNTVAGACRAAADLGVWMMNVHAAGGGAMMSAARAALGEGKDRPLLIAVTVLTSIDEATLHSVGVAGSIAAQVARLAALTENAGLDGVVCSPLEIGVLRAERSASFRLVTPGVRPATSGVDDQVRVATPGAAIRAGASYLVVGRPVTQAADPLAVLAAINAEIAAARRGA